PLDRPLEDIKKSFHRQSIRHKIKRAEKSGLAVRIADNETDIQEFYRLYTTTRKRLCLPAQPYGFFKSLWDVFHMQGLIRLLLATKEGTVVAGMISFAFNGRYSTEYLGS